MIVKNESHIIEKTLENLTNTFNFSYWVICDTGSSDNTQNIIKDFFKNKNIEGELIQHEWRDFGYNRTLALDAVYNKSDYVLIFDADDIVHGNLLLPELICDMYCLKIGKEFVYKRPLLVNNRLRWKFVGVLHEYLSCIDEYKSEMTISGDYYIESGKNGSRSFDPDKYIKDAKILEKAYNSEKDEGLRNRYAFYCAQSYMDANMQLESIKWYKTVINSNNWNQEKYYACLMIAKQLNTLLNTLNTQFYNFEIIKYLNLADTFDKERMEHITRLALFFYEKGIHNLVNAIYLQKRENIKKYEKLNINEKLFLDINDYYNKLEYYNSISGYYAGDFDSGYECCIKIIFDNNIFDNNKTIIGTNYRKDEYMFHSTINNLYFYVDNLKRENDDNTIKKLFSIINLYVQKNSNDNLFKIWNILFDKINFTNYIFYNKINNKNPEVFLSITTCKRLNLFQKTINSIMNNWIDYNKIDYWFCVDDNSSESDREIMRQKYPFFDYYFKNSNEKGHRKSMNIIWDKLNLLKPKYWIHLEDDFLFFDKMEYVSESISSLKLLANENIKQILFNRSYAETIEDYKIMGYIEFKEDKRFCIHNYNANSDNTYINNHYWPHYSFRPSMILTEAILNLGNYDTENHFFELDYANKWNDAGYKSAFFNKITNKHIGRLTKDRGNLSISNAYELNCETQFSKESTYIKVINLERRKDRKEKSINMLKAQSIENYEFIKAVDGKEINEDTKYLNLFYGNDFGNRRGFIGCALSHYNLWLQLINDRENEYYVILEDDITIADNFKDIIYKLKPLMQQKQIIYLGYHMYKNERNRLTYIYDTQDKSLIITKLNKELFVGGTFGYSINKEGAKYMLDYINENGIKHGIDYIIGKMNYDICFELRPHICFSEWHENENVDTDIQRDIDSINININININESIEKYQHIYDEFVFLKGMDQINNDIHFKHDTKLECMKIALSDDKYIGFNTLRFFKSKIENLTISKYFKDDDGIYIKKTAYDEYIKKNNAIISIKPINNTNKNIRVKMICNWSPSEKFCKEWSNLCETKNTWKNIEITHLNDVDYYVIINGPYENEYYEPSKTLIFQMEPWVYDKSKNWGIKTWGAWSKPDENKFLYVGTHKKALNNVQWQIDIPKSIPVNRYNKIIAVLSAKTFDIGHIKRINFIKYMEKENNNKINVFGYKNYHNFKNYCGQLMNDKKENHYIDYKYCLAVENNMEHNYATEKIWESILCECLTFYWGCPNLEDYIDSRAFVRLNLDNFSESLKIINRAIKEDWWSQRIEIIRREKQKIINELGFFPNLKKIITNYKASL